MKNFDAHQAWSDTVDEALAIAEVISRQQAHNLTDPAAQFEAAWWWIVEDDSILDGSARQWLRRFGPYRPLSPLGLVDVGADCWDVELDDLGGRAVMRSLRLGERTTFLCAMLRSSR